MLENNKQNFSIIELNNNQVVKILDQIHSNSSKRITINRFYQFK